MDAEPKTTTIRLNKADHKNIVAIRKMMRKANVPESECGQSKVIRHALEVVAKGGKDGK